MTSPKIYADLVALFALIAAAQVQAQAMTAENQVAIDAGHPPPNTAKHFTVLMHSLTGYADLAYSMRLTDPPPTAGTP